MIEHMISSQPQQSSRASIFVGAQPKPTNLESARTFIVCLGNRRPKGRCDVSKDTQRELAVRILRYVARS